MNFDDFIADELTFDGDNRAKTLLISATDGRGILIKVNLTEPTEKLELAKNLTPKDVNKWLQIKQDLDKRSQ